MTRPLYWSVRRELWENRSVYIAPLIAAALMLLTFVITLTRLPRTVRALALREPAYQRGVLVQPYGHAAMLVTITALLVGVFYCLDALYGERRDRGILFWKSLPVSDLTAVLSKASIPLLVLPIFTFAIVAIVQSIMFLLSSMVLLLSGMGTATLWTNVPLFEMELVFLYSLAALTLWHVPIYAWLLLVSGWARRTTFLWAFLPPLAIGVLEYMTFHASHFGAFMRDRFIGVFTQAFGAQPGGPPIDPHFIPLTQITPGRFLSTPGLWLGLVFAVICLGAAARLRRYRAPI